MPPKQWYYTLNPHVCQPFFEKIVPLGEKNKPSGIFVRVSVRKLVEEGTAAVCYVSVGLFEVARVPRVGNVAAVCGEVKELRYFPVGVSSEDAMHIADVGGVHSHEEVVFRIVCTGYLHRCSSMIWNRIFIKDFACAVVNIVAYLLG